MDSIPPEDFQDIIQLPHSREAEESIIGSVIIDPESYRLVSDLSADDFYLHRLRLIWEAIGKIDAEGLFIDFVTISAELERSQRLDEIGNLYALIDYMRNTPSAAHIESYARTIKRLATQRRHIDLAGKIMREAHNGGVDVAYAIDALSRSSRGEREGRHISGGLDALLQAVEERRANPVDVWGIPTGFIELDKFTGGIHKQQVLLLSGESGLGKTTIMLQAALAAAKAGYGVAIFEQEMDELRVLRRMVEIEEGVPNRAMLTGRMDEHMPKFDKALRRLRELPIFINDDPTVSTANIRGVISRLRTKMDIDAVYLDYLGLLNDKAPGNVNDYDQTKAVNFRSMCRELDLAGFAIQDMTKAGEESTPKLRDMSGGAKVRFGADVVLFIIRDQTNPNIYYLKPDKDRDSDYGKKFVTLTRHGLAFVDMQPDTINLRDIN